MKVFSEPGIPCYTRSSLTCTRNLGKGNGILRLYLFSVVLLKVCYVPDIGHSKINKAHMSLPLRNLSQLRSMLSKLIECLVWAQTLPLWPSSCHMVNGNSIYLEIQNVAYGNNQRLAQNNLNTSDIQNKEG